MGSLSLLWGVFPTQDQTHVSHIADHLPAEPQWRPALKFDHSLTVLSPSHPLLEEIPVEDALKLSLGNNIFSILLILLLPYFPNFLQ